MSVTTDVAPVDQEAVRLLPPAKSEIDGTVLIGWCISESLKSEIEAKGVLDPQLLLVVTSGDQEMSREVVPLFKMMHHVQFYRPGENVVHAMPLYENPEEGHPKRVIRRKEDGEYKYGLLAKVQPEVGRLRKALQAEVDPEKRELIEKEIASRSDDPWLPVLKPRLSVVNWFSRDSSELALDIPGEPFAKEQSRFIRWVAELGHKSKPKDECQMERRAYLKLAFSWLLIPAVAFGFLIMEAINLVALAFLLTVGTRGLSFSSVRRPFTVMPNAIWANTRYSVWYTKRTGEDEDGEPEYDERSWLTQLLAPPHTLVIAGVIAVLSWLWLGPLSVIQIFAYALGVLLAVAVVAVVVACVYALVERLFNGRIKRWRRQRNAAKRAAKKKSKQREKEWLATELDYLACDSRGQEVSLDALPSHRRTLRLKVEGFKAGHCKPLAK